MELYHLFEKNTRNSKKFNNIEENGKHKGMDIDFKKRILIGIILILIILTGVTGYYAFKLREEYKNSLLNNYNEAFSNVVNYVNNVENYLAKAMIIKSSSHASETLTQIWRDSNLALVYLARIPLEEDGLSQTSKFLNQVSDYAFSLSRKSFKGEDLEDADLENLEVLYSYSLELEQTLNTLSDEIYNGTISWDTIDSDTNLSFAQAVDNLNVFSSIDSNLNEYEGLIYDGAFSDHVNRTEKLGLTGEDITEYEAMAKVKEFFGEENIEDISSNGFIENADIPEYDFSVSLKDREGDTSIAVSQKGGHIVQTSYNRTVEEENISQEEANEIGKKYLEEKGFPNMKETYFMKNGNIVTVNYAYEDFGLMLGDNGTIVYSDLIKVKIALDNGEILGIETTGYLNAHTERVYENINIPLEEARESLSSKIEILSEGVAIIPTEWKTEILCYEFKGKVEEKEFLVYINIETGEEEDVLVILDTPGGTLTI